jgi:MFS family permease
MSPAVAGAHPGARRWLIVGALFLITYGMATPLASYGVFLPILAERFGWSRGAISAALSINLLVGGVAGFAAGALADRYGPRLILVVTSITAGAAFALVALVGALWQLYLLVGLLGGVGMSSFYLLSATTISRWFDARRGLALALVLVGFNLGYISAGPLAPGSSMSSAGKPPTRCSARAAASCRCWRRRPCGRLGTARSSRLPGSAARRWPGPGQASRRPARAWPRRSRIRATGI